MLATSVAGKTFIYFYRAIKTQSLFKQSMPLGKYYFGGFESPMTRREAALILGVR